MLVDNNGDAAQIVRMPDGSPSAEILSQGDEVVTGQTVDTNAAWLSGRLTDLGFNVRRHTAVGDRVADIAAAVGEAAARSDVSVCTGGLGPTQDDLTAQAVSLALDRPLAFDARAMEQIQQLFARFGKPMAESNRKQAWMPQGARRLDNLWGTAPGFVLRRGQASLFFLPGVPQEMRSMYAHWVEPILREHFLLQPRRLVTLRTAGIGESTLQQRIGAWSREDVTLSYRTLALENQLKLRAGPDLSEVEMRRVVAMLQSKIGESVFAIEGLEGAIPGPGGGLPEVVGSALVARKETLFVAEWGSGGRLSAVCGAVPGADHWFLGASVFGGTEAVFPDQGLEFGPADQGTEMAARNLADAVRRRASASHGLAVTLCADTAGHGQGQEPGATHVAVASAGGIVHRHLRLAGEGVPIQKRAAAAALDLLRRQIGKSASSSLPTGP